MDTRPLPHIEQESEVFWQATKKHQLMIQRCSTCGQLIFFPRFMCHACLSEDIGWITSSGFGTLYSYTIIRQTHDPRFQPFLPYVYAIIELDEGIRMLSNIVCEDIQNITVGSRVKVVFESATDEIFIPRFTLI